MCQPGRPGPQGLSHDGSPGFAFFHRAKSAGFRLRSLASTRVAGEHLLDAAMAELAVIGVLGHLEVHVAVERVGEALLDQPADDLDDSADVLSSRTGIDRPCRRPSC